MSSDGYFAQYDTGEMVYVEEGGFPEGQEFYPQGGIGSIFTRGLTAVTKFFGKATASSADDIARAALKTGSSADDIARAALKTGSPKGITTVLKAATKKLYSVTYKASDDLAARVAAAERLTAKKTIASLDDFARVDANLATAGKSMFKVKSALVDDIVAKAATTADDPLGVLLKKGLTTADDVPFKKIITKVDDPLGVLLKKGLTTADDVPFKKIITKVDEPLGSLIRETVETAATKPGLLSKLGSITSASISKKGMIAGALVVGAVTTVGIVSGMGSKSGALSNGGSDDKVAALQLAACGSVSDFSKYPDPAVAFSACKSCIVTGSETKDVIIACFQAKTTGPTPPVPSPGGIKDDVWTSGIGPSGYYPGDTGTYPDGGTGLKTAMMCSHPDNTAEQKQMCLECVKIADGATYYDRVAQIEACIAEKRKMEPGGVAAGSDICESPNLDAETKAFCKACQPLVADPQNETLLLACITDKRKTPAGDICNDPSLDPETKAFCKACQPLVANPQDATQLGACIAEKRKVVPPVTGDICEDSNLDASTKAFCKACQPLVANPQDETQLAACVVDKRSIPVVPPIYQDTNDPCDTNSRAFNVTVCSSGGGTVYAGTPVSQDTNDPCDTNSQMFDAAACTSGGGETYTSIQEEISPVVPLVILGGAAALIFVGMRKS